jgi:hypothetical protein
MPPTKDDDTGRRPPKGGAGGRQSGKGRAGEDPGLITRVERAARSIGMDLPTGPLREMRDAARSAPGSAATEAAGWLASDANAQAAGGIIVILVDEAGEMTARRDFGRRPRKR